MPGTSVTACVQQLTKYGTVALYHPPFSPDFVPGEFYPLHHVAGGHVWWLPEILKKKKKQYAYFMQLQTEEEMK
jgi:hypothetical protein